MTQDDNIYIKWAEAAAQNATSLAEEAKILLDHGKQERAYYLSHMANEESSKAILLRLLPILGVSADEQDQIDKVLRLHKTKITMMLDNIGILANKVGTKGSKKLVKELNNNHDIVTAYINHKKNNSMYVSVQNGMYRDSIHLTPPPLAG